MEQQVNAVSKPIFKGKSNGKGRKFLPPDKQTVIDDWVTKISAAWQKQVSSIVAVGLALCQAKDALAHGAFLSMFKDYKGNKYRGGQKLPFGSRTGEMLMDIAIHPILRDPKFVSNLPPQLGHLVRTNRYRRGTLGPITGGHRRWHHQL